MFKIKDSLIETQENKRRSDFSFIITLIVLTMIMAVITFLGQYVFLRVSVSGNSMIPTLHNEDLLIANRLKEGKKGDIIIIADEKEYWLVKRVIATEGDTVMFDKDGFVYINGEKYSDEFGFANHTLHDVKIELDKEYLLKEDEVFYLGDNRNNSNDSRDLWTCKQSQIVGVVESWSVNNKLLNAFFSLGKGLRNKLVKN